MLLLLLLLLLLLQHRDVADAFASERFRWCCLGKRLQVDLK